MATSNRLHRSIDDTFREENNGSAIRNAQVKYVINGTTPTSAANTNRKPARYQELNSYSRDQEQASAANTNTPPTKPAPIIRPKKTRLAIAKQMLRINVARVRALPVAAAISIWAWPWYLFLTLPLAILASISMGISYALYSEVDETALAFAMAAYQGVSPDAFLVVYFGLSGILLFSNVCQILIASTMFKGVMIKPWFGRGTTFKLVSIMLILISSFIPLLNMFPLLGLWVFAVIMNPK